MDKRKRRDLGEEEEVVVPKQSADCSRHYLHKLSAAKGDQLKENKKKKPPPKTPQNLAGGI